MAFKTKSEDATGESAGKERVYYVDAMSHNVQTGIVTYYILELPRKAAEQIRALAEELEAAAKAFDYDKRLQYLQSERIADPRKYGAAIRKLNIEYQKVRSPFLRKREILEQRLNGEKQAVYMRFTAVGEVYAPHSINEIDEFCIEPAK